jgi:hypothetical protein
MSDGWTNELLQAEPGGYLRWQEEQRGKADHVALCGEKCFARVRVVGQELDQYGQRPRRGARPRRGDVARDAARDLSGLAEELAALKGDATHWLTDP